MRIQCPNCQTVQKAPDDAVGKRARCRSCRDTFVIVNEYVPPLVVPVPGLPDSDATAVDAPPPKNRSGNILARVWIGIPFPFKTAFLATLGVVSALLFAWYVVRVPKWFNRPPTTPTTAGRPVSEVNPESALLLTEFIHCRDDYAALDTIQVVRAAFAVSDDPLAMLYSGKPNILVVTQAILAIDQRPPCTDAGMRLWSSQIRDALLAELRCQEYITHVADGIRSADAATMKTLVAEAVRRIDIAYETLILQTARFGVAE